MTSLEIECLAEAIARHLGRDIMDRLEETIRLEVAIVTENTIKEIVSGILPQLGTTRAKT